MEPIQVSGSFHVNGLNDGFRIRVKFTCPFCHSAKGGQRRHTQYLEATTLPDYADVEAECGLGQVRVEPYRKL